ncbi:hypothetical protein, partial [Dyadobacter luticola]|uniref:hypothetical protein n=1 Tax=Dyadobacter luticola TaxID=1979387 RepID=UPI00197ACFB5
MPPSCCLRIETICVSLNLVFFISLKLSDILQFQTVCGLGILTCFYKVISMLGCKISKYDLQVEDQGYISIFIKDAHPHHQLIVQSFYEIPDRIAVSKNPEL